MNERSASNKLLWLGAILVLALTFAAHVRGLQGQFVEWDDTNHITRNVAIRALTPENLRLMFAHPIAKLYCPLTWLSFAIDYQVWGRAPFGYHLTNLLLHLANTLLVLVFVREILRDRFKYATAAALLTAAIFCVDPLRADSGAGANPRPRRTRVSNVRSPSSSKTLPSESIGRWWTTLPKAPAGAAPTR